MGRIVEIVAGVGLLAMGGLVTMSGMSAILTLTVPAMTIRGYPYAIANAMAGILISLAMVPFVVLLFCLSIKLIRGK